MTVPNAIPQQCGVLRTLPIAVTSDSFIYNAQIATPDPRSGYIAEDYIAYSVYINPRDTVEYRVYGSGPDYIFFTRDDTGDRSIQAMPSSLGGGAKHVSAFGNIVAYMLYDSQAFGIIARSAGNDGYVGLGGDDGTSLLATSTTLPLLNTEFDIVANGDVFAIANDPFLYIIRQPLAQNRPQRNEVVNVDTPASTNDGYVRHFQTTLSGITSYQETAPNGQEIVTWFLAPGPNGMFESVASPMYDDQRHLVGRTVHGHSEEKGRLAYDANYAITISSYQQPASVVVNVYDFRPAGSNNGELRFLPTPTTVPLPIPLWMPPAPWLIVGHVDIDGAFMNFGILPNSRRPTIHGALAVEYIYTAPTGQAFRAIQYRHTGSDGAFMTKDDVVRTYPLAINDRIEDIMVKENMLVVVGRVSGMEGIHFADC